MCRPLLWISLFCLILLQSCATVFNSSYTVVKVSSDEEIKIIFDRDTLTVVEKPIKINPLRSRDTLKLAVIGDNINRKLFIIPKKSFDYWMNIPCTYGLGFIVDNKSDKRFTYPAKIHIIKDLDSVIYKKSSIQNRNIGFDLTISLPLVNSFSYQLQNGTSLNSIGFLGISIGLEYYYKKNLYVALQGSGLINFPFPFPAPIDYDGEHETFSSTQLEISNNHIFNRISIGYGLGYTRNYYVKFYEDDSRMNLNTSSISVNVPIYYRLGSSFRMGILYRPSIINLDRNSFFAYQHTLSLDLKWTIF